MSSIRYSIHDLEQLTGIKAHTLRIWEKRYGIVRPQRTCTNIRYYTDCDLKQLLNVSILNKHGYRISDIARLSDLELADRVLNIAMNPNDYLTQVESLVVAMIEMDEQKFDKILSYASMNLGFEETIMEIIYPFFIKVGLLWQTGSIVPAQEHFISNLIRQKLIVAIDGIPLPARNGQRVFILYLHEKELHEIGLLVYYYLLKKRGHRVIYLGQQVPYQDLLKVATIHPPYALVSCFTSALDAGDLQDYLHTLRNGLPGAQHWVSGLQLLQGFQPPEGVTYIDTLHAFRQAIELLPAS
ncbi:MAG TPA: MerR family transcriptional regulator [Bacteroidales bacterium]|nr:MerR family transcriptional regulator [Bacteroidales bacterium]HRZ76108.1 MerR family transcriptional regulator [Bacteroidales bacterium]